MESDKERSIRILIEMRFIELLSKTGYREEKMWSEEEDHILKRILEESRKLAKEILEI